MNRTEAEKLGCYRELKGQCWHRNGEVCSNPTWNRPARCLPNACPAVSTEAAQVAATNYSPQYHAHLRKVEEAERVARVKAGGMGPGRTLKDTVEGALDPADRLSAEQVRNWRSVLVGVVGPGAYYLSEDDIHRVKRNLESHLRDEESYRGT